MNDSYFKIEKDNHIIKLDSGNLTLKEIAVGMKFYLNEIADQKNYSLENIVNEFVSLVNEIPILDSKRCESISI